MKLSLCLHPLLVEKNLNVANSFCFTTTGYFKNSSTNQSLATMAGMGKNTGHVQISNLQLTSGEGHYLSLLVKQKPISNNFFSSPLQFDFTGFTVLAKEKLPIYTVNL